MCIAAEGGAKSKATPTTSPLKPGGSAAAQKLPAPSKADAKAPVKVESAADKPSGPSSHRATAASVKVRTLVASLASWIYAVAAVSHVQGHLSWALQAWHDSGNSI